MNYCGLFYGLFVANFYKVSAIDVIDDKTLTLAGMIGSLSDGSSRFITATLMDYYGFKVVYSLLLCIQLLAALSINSSKYNSYLYVLLVAISFFCKGAHFSMFPTCIT
jgi:nitrate/nitrite transporter NarK